MTANGPPKQPAGNGAALVLEQQIVRGTARPYERRVFGDGRCEERTDTVAEFVDGHFKFSTKDWVWERVAVFGDEAMHELRAAMKTAFRPPHLGVHRPKGTAIGGADITWISYESDPPLVITMRAHPATEIAEVDALGPMLDRLVAVAGDQARGWR